MRHKDKAGALKSGSLLISHFNNYKLYVFIKMKQNHLFGSTGLETRPQLNSALASWFSLFEQPHKKRQRTRDAVWEQERTKEQENETLSPENYQPEPLVPFIVLNIFVVPSLTEVKPGLCVCVCASVRTLGPCNINLLPHLRFLTFKGHGSPGAACVFALCAFLCVWQAKRWSVKGCDSRATIRGHHPQDPRGLTMQYCTTHTHKLFREGHWGPVSLVTCVCNHCPLSFLPGLLL